MTGAAVKAHNYLGTEPRDGYVGKCACGWESDEKPTRRSAQGAVAAHIGRAPSTLPSAMSMHRFIPAESGPGCQVCGRRREAHEPKEAA